MTFINFIVEFQAFVCLKFLLEEIFYDISCIPQATQLKVRLNLFLR